MNPARRIARPWASAVDDELRGKFAFLPKGHPIRTLAAEHARFLEILDDLERLASRIEAAPSFASIADDLAAFQASVELLIAGAPHDDREERVLFARLGERGIVGAPVAMAREHDVLREQKRALLEAVRQPGDDLAAFKRRLATLLGAHLVSSREHMYKEEAVLFPYALRVIESDSAWEEIRVECDAIGYCEPVERS